MELGGPSIATGMVVSDWVGYIPRACERNGGVFCITPTGCIKPIDMGLLKVYVCHRTEGAMRVVHQTALIAFVLIAPTLASAQSLTVLAISHSTRENDYIITTPQTTNTNCNLYPNSANCTSTTYGGGSQRKAVYRFMEVVTSSEDGKVTQYKLSRTARWVWNSMDWLTDGDSFPAEIKGKHMFITCRREGNQGKKIIMKYDVLDIRPAP
jgi:hypothetical protein